MFITAIWLAIVFVLWMPPAWLMMRFLTPKKLLDRYFKEPHFTSAEIALFSHFPGTLMRTGIFMNLCVWPNRGERRKITDLTSYADGWYITASKLFVFFTLFHGSLFFILSVISVSYILLFS